ncbi:helix-turn-helix domain-containing protein, partial [Bilophila wadsworthia]|uniref:helix-turn-helix domain-containing protein n=1 Tax=Bilophila wadsworthia TaxID=35833 RepID=UPI003AB22BE4
MPGYSKEDGNILKPFGAAVKAGRDGLGISQEALAEKAGLHRTYVGGVEQGRRNVSLSNIVKLSQALGVEALHPAVGGDARIERAKLRQNVLLGRVALHGVVDVADLPHSAE